MRLEDIRTFVAVARERSYTRAAQICYATPPTVLQRVRHLEAELGEKLVFVRGKEVCLTSVGAEFFECAVNIEGEFERFQAKLRASQSGRENAIRLGSASYWGAKARAVELLTARYPDMHVQYRSIRPWQAVEQIREGNLDFGFFGKKFIPDDLDSEIYERANLVFAVPPDHSLAGQSSVSIEEVLRHKIVGFQPGASSREAVDNWFATRPDLQIDYVAELINSIDIKNTAIRMSAPAMLMEAIAREAEADGQLQVLNVEGYSAGYDVYVVYQQGLQERSPAMTFLSILREVVASRTNQEGQQLGTQRRALVGEKA